MALNFAGSVVVACASGAVQPTTLQPTATSVPVERPTDTPTPVQPTVVMATRTPTRTPGPARLDLDKVLPAGEGRELLQNTCGSCHPWVCAIKGQRPRTHFDTLKASHLGLTPALSDEDYETLWEYLSDNFNDTLPEPQLPPEFQMLDCSRGI